MDETQDQQKQYSMMQVLVLITVLFENIMFVDFPFVELQYKFFHSLGNLLIYHQILYSKLFTLLVVILTCIGTRSRKELDTNGKQQIVIPLCVGTILFFASAILIIQRGGEADYVNNKGVFVMDAGRYWQRAVNILYILASWVGTLLITTALNNISKIITNNMLKDRFNYEGESFEQTRLEDNTPYSVNIPMQFLYKKKWNKGWMNIVNPFRGTLLIGSPGSGKSFSVVNSYIRQHSQKGFSLMVYDFKFPDLAKIAYYNYLANRKKGIIPDSFHFHVISFSKLEYSQRINPLKPEYIQTLADAVETASAVVESLKKGGSEGGGGSDQFFQQSAINFLACCLYYFSRFRKTGPHGEVIKDEVGNEYRDGHWSDLPHVLAFMNRTYEEIFVILFSEKELESLLSPFRSAYENKAFDQLEGMIGTLKVNLSRLATKESYWIFSGDDFSLKISDKKDPSYLIIANDPITQDINSALNALILNRLVRLVNTKGNLPCSIIIDEMPTIYFHKIANLIATARSNKVSVLMGIQERPQLVECYGKNGADVIQSVVGNVISGQATNKETLDWLQTFFGKIKMNKGGLSITESKTTVTVNENSDFVIPASKIATMPTGNLVARVAMDFKMKDAEDTSFDTTFYNCKTDLPLDKIKAEEAQYIDMPQFYRFGTVEERETTLSENYNKIINDIEELVTTFKERNPNLFKNNK